MKRIILYILFGIPLIVTYGVGKMFSYIGERIIEGAEICDREIHIAFCLNEKAKNKKEVKQ